MLRAMEQMHFPTLFLRDRFFREITRSLTEYVDIDVVKGKQKLAPFVSPLLEGKLVERLGFTTNTLQPPYIKPKMVTTAQDLLSRMAGEPLYSDITPEQRASAQLAKDLAYLAEQIDRREEWMCAQILSTGKVTCTGEGINIVVDFGLAGTHNITLTGNDLWSDTTNSNPLKDLRAWKRLFQKDSGLSPDTVIFSAEAYDSFIDHPKVSGSVGAFNTLRIDRGQIQPVEQSKGVTYLGFLRDCQCDAYTYDSYYLDENGVTLYPMIPAKKVIMASTSARAERHYAAIKDLEGLAPAERFPKSWTVPDPSRRFVMVQSAPLMAYHQIDALLVAQVLS